MVFRQDGKHLKIILDPFFVEPDKRSFIDLKNRKEVIDKALWSNTSKRILSYKEKRNFKYVFAK